MHIMYIYCYIGLSIARTITLYYFILSITIFGDVLLLYKFQHHNISHISELFSR